MIIVSLIMIYTRLMFKLVSVITNHKVMINQAFECIVLNWQDYIQVDENISIEVYFGPADREEGYQDDIRLYLIESGPKDKRIFKADRTGFLLTAKQAKQLAAAL